MNKPRTKTPDPIVSDMTLEEQAKALADSQTQPKTEALVKQDALPALGVVKNKNGTDRIVARQKGKFTSTANARVLAVQKSIERLMHTLDEEGQTQLERIISAQAKVCEENDSAKNLGGIAKFLEHVDEISGNKAAREALTKDINTPVIPTIIMVPMPNLMHPEVHDYDAQVRSSAERARKGPSFADAELVQQNLPRNEDRC